MNRPISVLVEGHRCAVDGHDVALWAGLVGEPDPRAARMPPAERLPSAERLQEHAAAYVLAHPRPAQGHAAVQRLALLRRLAAGPATRAELLVVLREGGWVGATDLENRLRDLRAADARAGRHGGGLAVAVDGQRYRLLEPFPRLTGQASRALAFAKAMVARLGTPLAEQAAAELDRLLPGLGAASRARTSAVFRSSAAELARLDDALDRGRVVRIRYQSASSGRESRYDLVPLQYATLGDAVKVVSAPVDRHGNRSGPDRQFALDRLIAVEQLDQDPAPAADARVLQTEPLVLDVADGLYQVMHQRNLLGIRHPDAEQIEQAGSWRVRGEMLVGLRWDVMEQLCAWAGNVVVHEPLWLLNAVCRRLRAGLRALETSELERVDPEPDRYFANHWDAVNTDAPLPRPAGPRKLLPR